MHSADRRSRGAQAARTNDRMCSRDVSARRQPDMIRASPAASPAPATPRPAVPFPLPFAQIEFNGGRNNPLWQYFLDHKDGPVLHKWCAFRVAVP